MTLWDSSAGTEAVNGRCQLAMQSQTENERSKGAHVHSSLCVVVTVFRLLIGLSFSSVSVRLCSAVLLCAPAVLCCSALCAPAVLCVYLCRVLRWSPPRRCDIPVAGCVFVLRRPPRVVPACRAENAPAQPMGVSRDEECLSLSKPQNQIHLVRQSRDTRARTLTPRSLRAQLRTTQLAA